MMMSSLAEKNTGRVERWASPETFRRIMSAPPTDQAEVWASTSGPPTVRVRGITLHGGVNPEAEARIWAERIEALSSPLAVFGFGFGYHLAALARRFPGPLTVIEPDPGLIRLAMDWMDLETIDADIRLVVDPLDSVDSGITRLLPHPPSVRLNRPDWDYWRRRIEDQARGRTRPLEDLAARWRETAGGPALLSGFEPGTAVGPALLAQKARREPGPLNQAAILALLIDELARLGPEGPF
jgi:hypothetical protein